MPPDANEVRTPEIIVRPERGAIVGMAMLYVLMFCPLLYFTIWGPHAPGVDPWPMYLGILALALFAVALLALYARQYIAITATEVIGRRARFPISAVTSAILSGGAGPRSLATLRVQAGAESISLIAFLIPAAKLHLVQETLVARLRLLNMSVPTRQPQISVKALPAIAMLYLLGIVLVFGGIIWFKLASR